MNDLRMAKKLPPSLQGTFWVKLITAIEEELVEYQKEKVDPKQFLFDLENMDMDRLKQLSSMLGVYYDATLNSDEDFLRREVESVPFKILYKGTAILYKSFAKSLDRNSEMFIYFYKSSSQMLVRDSQNPLLTLPGQDPTLPFTLKSDENFTGFVEENLVIDSGLLLDVESGGSIWTLDTSNSQISSNHFAIEFVVDRIITKQTRDANDNLVTKEYLMTQEYLAYIMGNVEFARRAKEVPHIGSQLTCITDLSGFVDAKVPGAGYSMPSIKAKVCARPDMLSLVTSIYDASYLEFGIGTRPLATRANPVAFPTSLGARVGRTYLMYDERWEDQNWFVVNAEYLGQQINYLTLVPASQPGSPDGTLTTFSFTLPYAPIQRGNVKITFTYDTMVRTLMDDRKGKLVSDFGSGTINYTTGACTLNMDFTHTVEPLIAVAPAYDDPDYPNKVNYTATYDAMNPLIPESCWLYFTSGDAANQRKHAVRDDGLGHFVHPLIASSVVDYTNKAFTITFTTPLTPGSELTGKYSYQRVCPPADDTAILGDYYFTNRTLEITEVGLFSKDDVLMAYATFPPLEFSSVQNHCNMMLAVSKKNF